MAVYCITGIAGFIGSSLACALVEQGHTVRGIDDLSTGSLDNLSGYEDDIEIHIADICDLAAMKPAMRGADFVLHHAANASVHFSVQDPISTNNTNVNGTLNVLVAARDAGAQRVVFAASSSAYGDPPAQPNIESMVPSPLSPYAAQKVGGEQYMQAFTRAYGLPTVCLRYFNVFGPRQSASSPYSGVIAKFINDMLNRETPRIFGDGNQTRDFTYISNIVQANILACHAPGGIVSARVFNIGSGVANTLNATLAALAEIFGASIHPKYMPERAGDIRHSKASIELARECLGYLPMTDFKAGLQDTVDWYRGKRQASYFMEETLAGR